MKYITFSNGLKIPALGQGTWFMGEDPAKREAEIKSLRTGLDLGMSAIDTAEMYGEGLAEQLVGEAIKGVRDKAFLISKVYPWNAGRTGMVKACENSLRRLGTDRLDLYLLHWAGSCPIEETVEAMMRLRQAGKILQWGVSNIDVDGMDDIMSVPGGNTCATDEVLYNLTRRGVEFDLLPWCKSHNMPMIAYSPIEQGRLLGNPTLEKIAGKHSVSPAQIALAWVLSHANILAIPKASSVRHVKENFDSMSVELTADDIAMLDKAFPTPRAKWPLETI